MRTCIRFALAASLTLVGLPPAAAAANGQADPVECWVENLSPSLPVNAQATYVVHLSGGLGTYAVALAYGDGTSDSQSISAQQASFTHRFGAPGTYTQTASVSGAGSSATCFASTSVY